MLKCLTDRYGALAWVQVALKCKVVELPFTIVLNIRF